jgi:endonuclease
VRVDAFREWLAARFAVNTVSTQLSTAKRVEAAYGDLDEIFERDRFESLIGELTYSKGDEVRKKLNPSKMQIERSVYDTLSSCRTALRTYRNFREDPVSIPVSAANAMEVAGELIRERKEGKQFEVERHLQEELRKEISQLESGLTIIDGSSERSVESGFIDILAQDQTGALVVIELKSGTAKREAIGQIVGYMGDLMQEEPSAPVRGILVAADFDKSCQSGVRAIPTLKLKRYRFSFTFEEV